MATVVIDGAALSALAHDALAGALDEVVAGRAARIAFAVEPSAAGSKITLSFDGGIGTPSHLLSLVALAPPAVRAVVAWGASRGAQMRADLRGPEWQPAALAARVQALLDLFAATPLRMTIVRGTPTSERGEPPEYGFPSVVLELLAGAALLRATALGMRTTVAEHAAIEARTLADGRALAAKLGIACELSG